MGSGPTEPHYVRVCVCVCVCARIPACSCVLTCVHVQESVCFGVWLWRKVRVQFVRVCVCVYSRQPLMGIMCGVSSADTQKHANPQPPPQPPTHARPALTRMCTHAHKRTNVHSNTHTLSVPQSAS